MRPILNTSPIWVYARHALKFVMLLLVFHLQGVVFESVPFSQPEPSNLRVQAAELPVPPHQDHPQFIPGWISGITARMAIIPAKLSEPQAEPAHPDPLKLLFPADQLLTPVTARPPLYPIPWAVFPYDHFYFSVPISANRVALPLAEYRYGAVYFPGIVHSGVDLQVPKGTPVNAAAGGWIVWADYGALSGYVNRKDPYGIAVLIRHDFGWQGKKLYTLYAHLSRTNVFRGQFVDEGYLIGWSGQTGKATGPHLHFEVLQENGYYYSTFNPELWLVPPQGWGVLAGRIATDKDWPLKGFPLIVRSKERKEVIRATTYHNGQINSDPYYRENVTIGNLPAGIYELQIDYYGKRYKIEIQIHPGQVNYFTFTGRSGFKLDLPPPPGADFVPQLTP
jgi:hypothetical protein